MTHEEFIKEVSMMHHPLDEDVVIAMANKAYAEIQRKWILEEFYRPIFLLDRICLR